VFELGVIQYLLRFNFRQFLYNNINYKDKSRSKNRIDYLKIQSINKVVNTINKQNF
jgi:hypothetical protein